MTDKQCKNCIYSVDGYCRLENTHGLRNSNCPYKEGNGAVFSVF